MEETSLDLFVEHKDTQDATVEELAAFWEVTVDYYLAEFC
jgi:hypothetical protein